MREFWNHKSKTYPTPTDEEGLKTPKKVLSKAKEFGIDFVNRTILDIGCGTGLYSAIMAKEAKSVLGVDISSGMLSKLNEYIKDSNITNITTKEADFKEFDKSNKFDIVLSAMTPAISKREDLETMINLAKEACIYIGFAGKRESPLMNEVLTHFGFEYESKDGFAKTTANLRELGYEYKETFFEHNWSQVGTLEEATNDVIEHLKMKDFEVDREAVKEVLKPHLRDGKIKRETFSKIGLLVWFL